MVSRAALPSLGSINPIPPPTFDKCLHFLGGGLLVCYILPLPQLAASRLISPLLLPFYCQPIGPMAASFNSLLFLQSWEGKLVLWELLRIPSQCPEEWAIVIAGVNVSG